MIFKTYLFKQISRNYMLTQNIHVVLIQSNRFMVKILEVSKNIEIRRNVLKLLF